MKLRKVLAGVMALCLVAGSLLVGPVEAKAAPQTVADVHSGAFWTGHSAGVAIYDGGTYTFTYQTKYTGLGDEDGQNNWDAPLFVLYSGTEAIVNGAGYSEHWVGRADNYGWAGTSGATGTFAATENCNWDESAGYGWAGFLTAMANGTSGKLVVTREENVVVITSTIAHIEYKSTVTLPDAVANTDAIYISLFAQSADVTNISWVAPASVEITHKIAGTTMGGTTNMMGRINAVPNTTDEIPDVITWTSSDESIATVDANGIVTLIAPGVVTITATCGPYTDTCTFEIVAEEIPMTGIELTTDKTEIKVGATAQLTTTVAPEDTTDDKTVTYTSSDATIATVDATGKVTAVKPGTVTITAKVGEFTDTVEITVPVVPVTSIDLKADKTDLEKGDIVNIVATVNPADTTEDKTITWTSSNEKVAKVDANGTVTAVGGGNATITATIGEVTKSIKFKVTAQETVVEKTEIADLTVGAFLSVQTDGIELKKGHTYTFTFTGKGTDATSTNYYETPCYFVYTNSVNKFNVENYKEIIFARGDVWCWFDGDTTKNPDALPEGATFTRTYPANWDNWVAAMKAGAECKIVVKYDGKTITATYSVADANTVASFPVTIPSGSKLYLGLTGEKVAITDIEVADEYVKTITGTGDFNMVLPLVLVLFGGAVVIVAAKKRIA